MEVKDFEMRIKSNFDKEKMRIVITINDKMLEFLKVVCCNKIEKYQLFGSRFKGYAPHSAFVSGITSRDEGVILLNLDLVSNGTVEVEVGSAIDVYDFTKKIRVVLEQIISVYNNFEREFVLKC